MWEALFSALSSKGGKSGGSGMFSGSSTANASSGSIGQDFSVAPVYNPSFLRSLEKANPVTLAIAAVAVVLVVAIWRKK